MSEVLVGRKSGESSSTSTSVRAAVEAPESLRSRQHVRVLHVICEGEIEGIVGGDQGIFFDDVPLQNSDGSYNFSSVSIDTRTGTQWQGYMPITGLEAEQSVGVELKGWIPIERAITDTDADAVRVTVSVPQLFSQNTQNGDTGGSSAIFRVEAKLGSGAWYQMCEDILINGKTMSRTQFSYYLRLPVSGGLPRYIRATRMGGDSTSSTVQNRTFFDSFTLLWDEKLRYPNTALCGVSIDGLHGARPQDSGSKQLQPRDAHVQRLLEWCIQACMVRQSSLGLVRHADQYPLWAGGIARHGAGR
jgi:predicted phage tail protein